MKKIKILFILFWSVSITSWSQVNQTLIPTKTYLDWANADIGILIHYDMQFFTPDYEWQREMGKHTYASIFNPKQLDIDQWIETPKAAVAKLNYKVEFRDKIAAVRYAPLGMYLKDHWLIYNKGIWHLFAPLGPVGTMWHNEGSEESAEHIVSNDLVNWEHIGTAVPASRKEGYFDRLMGGIAPCVVKHEGVFYMIYSGWDFKSKNPRNFEGFRQGIGIAVSKDLYHWEKPENFAKYGIKAEGSDPFVVRDEDKDRWILYTTRMNAVAVYEGENLFNWQEKGMALDESDLKVGMTGMNPGESPFIMRHPKSQKWMIFMNGGYSVSDDPLDFPPINPYPFKSGIYTFPEPRNEGEGTYYYAEDEGTGFAHEIIEFEGQWYMTGAVGVDGHTKLKLTPIEWTADGFRLSD